MDTVLDARDLHAWYGSSHVLHGVDLRIARGQTVGLLGRNGMGKSTLIRTLLGHVRQRDGQIQMFGRDMSRARPHEVSRLGVAYVPEGRGVFPNLSVRENLVMAARRGPRRPRRLATASACCRPSRGCRSASITWARSCPAASSRCCRSAAR